MGWVEPDELALLDRRERHYDRVDVTESTTVRGPPACSGSVAVYVPRQEAIEHYERARDAGRAAIEQRYWDLVDRAFAAFGAGSARPLPQHHAGARCAGDDAQSCLRRNPP